MTILNRVLCATRGVMSSSCTPLTEVPFLYRRLFKCASYDNAHHLAFESGKVSPDQPCSHGDGPLFDDRGPHGARMKNTGPSESERPSRRIVWALIALAAASLCYSIRFMILYPRPELPFFFRYELASLGVGTLTGAAAQLFFKGSSARRWLRVVSWVALVAAIVGLFQMPH
jgi:hypothetical protein